MSLDNSRDPSGSKPLDVAFLDKRVIALRPALVALLGGDLALAALLQQLRYRMTADRGVERHDSGDGGGWWCDASRSEIADDLGISETQARRLVEKARVGGYIETSQPFAAAHDRRLFARFPTDREVDIDPGPRSISTPDPRPESTSLPIEGFLEKPKELKRALPPFSVFWEHYPRRAGARAGRVAAEREWNKLSWDECEAAFEGLDAYARMAKGYPQDAERYLKHRRWVGLEVETSDDRDRRIIERAESTATWLSGGEG